MASHRLRLVVRDREAVVEVACVASELAELVEQVGEARSTFLIFRS
jgi:hypothetical protein